MRHALSLVVVGLVAAASAKEPASYRELKPRIAALVESRWGERQAQGRDRVPGGRPFPDGPAWNLRVAPPFPAAWPPDGKGRLVVYAFAGGMRPGLRDAEEVAAPWGRVTVDGDALSFADLGELRSLGVHGVRPIAGEELAIARSGDAAADDLAALARGTTLGDAPRVQRFYRQWLRDGGLGDELRRLHPAFTAWVEGGKVR